MPPEDELQDDMLEDEGEDEEEEEGEDGEDEEDGLEAAAGPAVCRLTPTTAVCSWQITSF